VGTRAVIPVRLRWNSLTGQLRKCLEGGGQPLEPSTHRLCISAKTDSEVLWLLEEFPWHHAGLEVLAQDLHKFGGTACPEARKHGGAEAAEFAIELWMPRQEVVHQQAIRLQQCAGAIAHAIEIVEDNHGEKLGWMDWASVCEIDDLPHALDELRLGKNPSTANAAEAIGFGQTAGNDEIRSKMKGRTPGLVE
jgi:hypothetical protein